MPDQITRRDILKGIGAGAITLKAVESATAATNTRYIVTTQGRGVRDRIERAGFTVTRQLADGGVLLVEGTGSQSDLDDVNGVSGAARDHLMRFNWDSQPLRTGSRAFSVAGNPPLDDADLREDQWDKDRMDIETAHETATGEGTTIAIIDSGITTDHPAIPNLDTDAGRRFKYGSVDSGTGEVVRPADVFDLCAGTESVEDDVFEDTVFHGTWVAGVAGARRYGDDDRGILGTAPDTTMIPLKVSWWDEFDYDCDGDGTVEENVAGVGTTASDILSAIDYAASVGVDAINLSVGFGPLPPQANQGGIRAAFERVFAHATQRGSVPVAAAGNASTNLQQGGFFDVPSSIAGSMGISATGPNDLPTFFTNYGTNTIDVGAPGGGYDTFEKTFCTGDGEIFVQPAAPFPPCTENCDCTPAAVPYPYNGVLSPLPKQSWLGELLLAGNNVDGGLFYFSGGTSASAPQVTGTVALVREVAPDARPRQVEQAIKQGADIVHGQNDPKLGAGRLNAAAALDAPVISN